MNVQLVACAACGKQVSSMAPTCPGCGHPRAFTPQQVAFGAPPVVVAKAHWTQDRNLGCLAACILFLVVPTILFFAMCSR